MAATRAWRAWCQAELEDDDTRSASANRGEPKRSVNAQGVRLPTSAAALHCLQRAANERAPFLAVRASSPHNAPPLARSLQ